MISHKHKCIFVHIPRTAGTYIERLIVGGDWWKKERRTKHLLAGQARRKYAEHWDEYFKFSFVRNPWSRMGSLKKWNYYGVGKDKDGLKVLKYKRRYGYPICLEIDRRFYKRKNLIRPHHKPNTVYGNILDEELDFIGKVENLEEDLGFVLDKIKLNAPIKTKKVKKYSLLYSDKVKEEVFDLYKEDIARFGYEFDK